ncbi:ribonuclease H-like domain-containing protein [Mycena olivaceomarginata]|nr:ribonuclease H-like domain-containing protein [Mycena olivaceomarginata]KAJ7833125.1 ribonuclease H-like domain-containing protein [Mycena olivaceomarginata]
MPYQIDVWTDGACRGNGEPGAVAGAGAWFSRPMQGSTGWSRPLPQDPVPTNQRAELAGVVLALELAVQRREQLDFDPFFILTIHTDSRYAIGCLCDWIEKWKYNGWCNARGLPVANRDLIEEASDMIDGIKNGGRVDFVWVPREQNVEADRLANEACDKAEQDLRESRIEYHTGYARVVLTDSDSDSDW